MSCCQMCAHFKRWIKNKKWFSKPFVPRYDDAEGGLESEEFLPSANGKKPIRFTDVSKKVWIYVYCYDGNMLRTTVFAPENTESSANIKW